MKQLIKNITIQIYKVLTYLIPVNKKMIIFQSRNGRNYTGNPRYIYEEMVREGLDQEYECIWFFFDTSIEVPGKCKKIRNNYFPYFWYLMRAGIWVFDSRQPLYVRKKKHITYIQTWHGTPLKKLALDMEDVFMVGESDIDSYKEHFTKNVHTWDFLISQNPFSSETFRRAFDFHREMLEYGYPRNDILFRENTTEGIRSFKRKLGLPEDKKIILYAPTWRDDEFSEDDKYEFRPQISFEKLQKELGDEYIMIVKYHYLIMDAIDWSPYEGFIYHFDQSRDIAELFLVSDILITDYSSVMFDYSILNRPMFFFAYDFYKYKNELRGFYFSYSKEMPGPISTTTDELIEDIHSYDYSVYAQRYEKFKKKYNSIDDGRAASRVLHLMKQLIPSKRIDVYYE